jgi:gamma-glutamylcyclotransferase (GGCT)/AIG2-like uncharacterized protein YtfP
MRRHYTQVSVPDTQLYFAYTSLLDPERMSAVAPGAKFLFTAHYPETRLVFVANGSGPVPTLIVTPGSTVWGGVFEIPDSDLPHLTRVEAEEGRAPGWDLKAIDRAGNKHDCLTFISNVATIETTFPTHAYLDAMIRGARHWELPAGWVVGLEDLSEDPLFK